MDATTGLLGRDRELARARQTLDKGANLLIQGRAGIGKSALLRELFSTLPAERIRIWVPEGSAKEQAYELARQAHAQIGLADSDALPGRVAGTPVRDLPWGRIRRAVRRMPARECVALVATTLETVQPPPVVFFESLELPPSQAEQFAAVLEVAQVAAAMDDTNRRVRIRRLLWRFPERERIELRPLPGAATEAITRSWLEAHPIAFEDDTVRDAFIRAVRQDSGGMPAAIQGMLEQARSEPQVTRRQVRAFRHDAGIRYIDMTPVVVIGIGAAIAFRYIARGIDSTEIYVLAGTAIGLAVVLRYFVMPMAGRP